MSPTGSADGLLRLRREGPEPAASPAATLTYATSGAGQFIDITDDVQEVVDASHVREGLVLVYSRHTTAAIRVNEHEPLLLGDLQRFIARLAPAGAGYEHDDLERRPGVPEDEPRNAHAHCQQLLMGASETLPVVEGRIWLGRWQRIFLVELCSARQREVVVRAVPC